MDCLDIWLKELNKSICDNWARKAKFTNRFSYFFDKGELIRDKDNQKNTQRRCYTLIEEYSYGDYSIMAKILGDIIDTKNQIKI